MDKLDIKQIKNLINLVTKSDLDFLITNSYLIKGAYYKITDRGHLGLVVYAVDTNKIALNGILVYCTPNYITGQIWDSLNTYNINDVVIWGGKYWTNNNGLVGTSLDSLLLDSEWTEVYYTDILYTQHVYDCRYDIATDTIIEISDNKNNILNSNFEYFRFGDDTVTNNKISNLLIDNINLSIPYNDNIIIGGNGSYSLGGLSGVSDRLVYVDSNGYVHPTTSIASVNYATFSATYSPGDTKTFIHNFDTDFYTINMYNTLSNSEVYGTYVRNVNSVDITLSGSFSQISTNIILR